MKNYYQSDKQGEKQRYREIQTERRAREMDEDRKIERNIYIYNPN